MKVLVLGKGGQLASELEKSAPNGLELAFSTRQDLDLEDSASIRAFVSQVEPEVVINTAAYTAVDKAEEERERANAVNHLAVAELAQICKAMGSRLLHISTDFVFDGRHHLPYQVDDAPAPLSVYGQTKRDGEIKVLENGGDADVVIRTSWLYSSTGNNFVKTMLKLMEEREQLSIVCDQVGTPTWAADLAHCVWQTLAAPQAKGIYHWSDAGVASWYDFAVAIQELGLAKGLLKSECELLPIPSSAYPTPATRPAYSVLDKSLSYQDFDLKPVHWRKNLELALSNWN